ncbi:MAG TPA: alpha/beta hydrolase [Acidimicrobiia bacterium]|nr:alpha/beta hydrolase [Acidimicrobiia bacterium]
MKWFRRGLLAAAMWRLFGPVVPLPWPRPQKHPWRIPARTMFAGNRELSIREVGPLDGPPLVLIHGLAGSSIAEWYKVAPLLADRFRVLMIDHRSHGLSVADKGRFEIADVADDIASVLDQLDTGPVALVGYSMGGAIVQALAHRHPDLVSRLVLVATLSHHPRGWRELRQLGALITRAWERATGTGTPEVRTAYLLSTGVVAREHGRWLWEETHRRDPDAGAQASRALFRFDSRAWLPTLRVPTLVVIPERDQLVPAKWQREMARLIERAETVEVVGGRHEIPWSHAELLAQRIEKFLVAETG